MTHTDQTKHIPVDPRDRSYIGLDQPGFPDDDVVPLLHTGPTGKPYPWCYGYNQTAPPRWDYQYVAMSLDRCWLTGQNLGDRELAAVVPLDELIEGIMFTPLCLASAVDDLVSGLYNASVFSIQPVDKGDSPPTWVAVFGVTAAEKGYRQNGTDRPGWTHFKLNRFSGYRKPTTQEFVSIKRQHVPMDRLDMTLRLAEYAANNPLDMNRRAEVRAAFVPG